MAVNAAFEGNRKAWMGDDKGFAAHVAFYPVCKPYLQQEDLRVTGAPMINLYGTDDSYWDPVAAGHRSHTAWNADAANDSLGQVVSFLRKTLTAK
ncbi:MAG: hypothetical protein ACLQO1_10450 [Steroidobacteraceae bacterium]